MLTDKETEKVWEYMVKAEVRSLYFGALAVTYRRKKQAIEFLTLLFSSSAVVTSLLEVLPAWILAMVSVPPAVMMAYSIGTALSRKIRSLEKLHSRWNRLADDYRRLWNHSQDESAQDELARLRDRSREVSEAGLQAPYKEKLITRWADHVYSQYPAA